MIISSSYYNFYIHIDNDIIIQQKCERFINEELPNIVKQERKDLMKDNPVVKDATGKRK